MQGALDYKARIARGENPVAERNQERDALRGEKTPAQLIDDYMNLHAKPHKKSWREDQGLLARYLPSSWKSRRLSEFSHDEIVRLHQKIGRENGQYAANHFMRLLRAMFNLAKSWHMLSGDNPAIGVKFFREEKRDRFLAADELKRLNQALLDEPDWRWRAFFPLSLFLGTRRGELMTARWADFDLDARLWRIPDTKAGRPHLLPLPKAALRIFNQLPSRGKSEWVFPGEGKDGHVIEPSKAWQRIRQRAGLDGNEEEPKSAVRVHDLRRTLGSWLAASGYSLPLIGRALNHSNVSTTTIYARLNLDPVREALEQNARLMVAVSAKGDAPSSRSRREIKPARPRRGHPHLGSRTVTPEA